MSDQDTISREDWIVKARKRCEAATEGPWADNDTDSWRWPGISRTQLAANRKFIAHAPTDLPRALDVVEAADVLLGAAASLIIDYTHESVDGSGKMVVPKTFSLLREAVQAYRVLRGDEGSDE